MGRQALEGVKVVDFGWIGVGPSAAEYLGDNGATVVRVESNTKLDALRILPPFKDQQPAETRLNTFQNQELKQAPVIMLRQAPFGIMVGHVKRIFAGPGASRFTVVIWIGTVIHRRCFLFTLIQFCVRCALA